MSWRNTSNARRASQGRMSPSVVSRAVTRVGAGLLALTLAMPVIAVVMPIAEVSAAPGPIAPAADEVTYKEYWVPHTQFSGSCSSPVSTSGFWYVEPSPCAKTLTFTIPDNISGALRAEIYLDLWRNRDVPKLRFRLNGGLLRDPEVGADWGRTPYLGAIPLSELRQGANTIELLAGAPVHVHDIALRVYHDATHPLVAGPGSDVTPPNGALTSIVASNGTFGPSAGGALVVNNDTLTFTATATDARYVDFIGFYDGFDIDADGQTTEWQATGRNNWFPGGRSAQTTGGLINHIGSDATAPYQVTWQLPHVKNQSGVRFKVRVVDAAGNVREAAGGQSAAFDLTRSDTLEYYTIDDFDDAVLHHDGLYPNDAVRTIQLPDMTGVVSARLLGNFWNNPFIQVNGNPQFRAFPAGADQWRMSNVVLNLAHIGAGPNILKYSYSGSGFGEFIEKPGPMIVLRRRVTDPAPAAVFTQTTSATVSDGMAATLRVVAAGSPLISYQWFRDGQPIDGATGSTYITPALSAADAGTIYTVTLTNRWGSATSAPIPMIIRGSDPWWNSAWPYRFEVNVGGAGVARTDKIVELNVNFTSLLDSVGQSGRLDPDTIRLIEVDPAGNLIDDNIAYQFDGVSSYDAETNARGTLVFRMDGVTAANSTRRFHVYFAKTGSGIGAFPQPFPLAVIDNVFDEGQNSFKIATPGHTWYYHKQGAGFSTLLDAQGLEWLGYRPNVAGSGGTFRGVPNAIFPDGEFHPGALGSTTTLVKAGPLKATLRSATLDGEWVIQWDIYLTYAKATFLRAPRAYWFLFEGTPGGTLQTSGNDIVVRSNGVQNSAGASWQADIPGDEWVYVGDVARARSFFVAQLEPDNTIDSYRPMDGNMTVLGFGRRTNEPQLRATPNTFFVGLIDTTNFAAAKPLIEDRYKPVDLTVGLAELQAGPSLPGAPTDIVASPGDQTATVTWKAPVQTGGRLIQSYVVTPSIGTPVVVDGTETEALVDGLANDAPVSFTVRAITSAGEGPESDPSATVVPSANLALESDDFNSRALRGDWSFVDPQGDTQLLTTGNELVLRVAGGRSHDLFTNAILAPQVLQATENVDFQTVLKYENAPTQVFQMQGFVAKEDDRNLARFDMLFAPAPGYPNGVLKVAATTIVNGLGELRLEALVPGGQTRFLRVTRTGDVWALESSVDGSVWLPAGQFEQPFDISQVGVFAGNHATDPRNSPQFISRLDYIFNSEFPIIPEDAVPDSTPVQIADLVATPSETRFAVALSTDQLASMVVDYGLTPGYELGTTTATAIDTTHRAVVAGLQSATQYYFRVRVADVRGTSAVVEGQSLTTLEPGVGSAIVNLWYGASQSFGFIGQPQRWVNVLGNVRDVDGIAVASFSLNGGASEFLQVGKDDRRLALPGDFNVEIAASRLLRGLNRLTITFVDLYGATTTSSVDLFAERGQRWPLPYRIDWDQVSDVTDVAQVVDGHWRIEDGQLRTADIGYDRLLAIGDLDWTDYEITVPITPHSKDDAGYAFPSSGPAIGLLLRWPGHYEVDDRQPRWGYAPLGALGWYRFQTNLTNKLVISDGQGLNAVSAPTTFQLEFGSTYIFKMRVQTIASGANPGHQYTLSVWKQGQPEQSGVTISSLQPLTGLQSGSALLVAHHVDASFGDISVTRVNNAIKPAISPAGGVYTAGQTISISSPDPGASIYYTVDGSEPTTSSARYSGPFMLNVDATVKAMAVRPDVDVSSVTTAAYFIRKTTAIRSDAFSSTVLDDSVWTLIDPQNDALPFFSKTATDARLNLFVPAGQSHDLFDTRLLAPRLLQAAPNADFEVEAKFQGTYSGSFTMQGLVAQQTFRDFLRVDVYRTGSARRLYAATFVNGVATTRLDVAVPIGTTSFPDVYMRLRRQGNTFTVLWSSDGQAWTSAGSFSHPMVVTAVGPWVGSHSGSGSTSQAMTAVIDYFANLAAPIIGEDSTLPGNLAPAVNAGPDLSTIVGASPSLLVAANATDDQTATPAMTYTWSKVSGPGNVVFGATVFSGSNGVRAGVAFDFPGDYVLQLCASDGSLQTWGPVRGAGGGPPPTAPVVDAGRGAKITTAQTATLIGAVSDDGTPGALSVTWTQVSGPTGAVIASPASTTTAVTFAQRGTYLFELRANDGLYSASDFVEVTVVDGRSVAGLRAMWDFNDESGSVIRDVSGVGDPLDLHISTPSRVTWGPGSLTVNAEVQIASHQPATKVSSAVAASGEYTVEAWIRPASLGQFGPARIVSISSGSSARNFTLGQGSNDFLTGNVLDVRTRATSTGSNGTPSLESERELTAGLTHVVVTRSASGTVTVWANGVQIGSRAVSGSLNWDMTMPLNLANEFGGGRPWLGEFRLVAIYDRAFDAAAVASHYQHGPVVIAPNEPPAVDAGPDSTTMFPLPAQLSGSVSDDGRPSRVGLLTRWSKVSGPGTVEFANASALDTTASFSEVGTYELALTADDGEESTVDHVIVTVTPQPANVPPNVQSGPDLVAILGTPRAIDATVSDDGLPIPPQAFTVEWSLVSGPGTATFSTPTAIDTNVSFSAAGTYVLRLTANDGGASAFDDVAVVVKRPARVDSGVVGLWNFQDGTGSTIRDVSGVGTPLDLVVRQPANVTWTADGLRVDAATVISSSANASKLIAAAKASNAFTVELWVDPASVRPTSQGRIFSIAGNSNVRNVAFGQGFYDGWDTAQYRSRIGTTSATQPFLVATVPSADLTHVVITRRGDGQVKMFVDGVERHAVNTQGTLSSWAEFPMFLANESGANRPWLGEYRLVAFFDRALSVAEVGQNFLAGPRPNARPVANAGADAFVELGTVLALDGEATDDGLPDPPALLTTTWRTVSGPAPAVFVSPNSTDTNVSFPVAGTYVLALDASDGSLIATDAITVTVAANAAPGVDAGPAVFVEHGSPITLTGTVSDDGLPIGSTVTVVWDQVAGPGLASLGSPTSLTTTVSLPVPGEYTFRLTANDTVLSSVDTVVVRSMVNSAPVVDAGPGSTVAVNRVATVSGSASDDALPAGSPLSVAWFQQAGPGTAVFTSPLSTTSQVSFDQVGLYVLRLEASDGSLTSIDTVEVNVTEASVPNAPAVFPAGGVFTQSVVVRVPSTSPAGVIRYTIDGSEPSEVSPVLPGALVLTSSAVLKAREFAPGELPSVVAENSYTVNASARVSNGMVSLYRFDEGGGTRVHDVSGVGTPLDLDLTSTAGATWGAGRLALSGGTAAASAGGATKVTSAVSTSGELTVEAWLTPAVVSSAVPSTPGQVVSLAHNQNTRNFQLSQGFWNSAAADVWDARLRTTGGNTNTVTSGSTKVRTQLTHVVYTRSASGAVRLYVNGAQVAAGGASGTLGNWDSTMALVIGNRTGGGGGWNGELHLVALFSRALSAGEVAANFAVGAEG